MAAETRTIGAPSRNVPRTSVWISSSWRSIHALSALSHLLRTTIPWRTARRRQMSRCSRVCGITPSSAAMTSRTMSTPAAPAHHRPDEPLVPRHVDDPGERPRREGEAGEPELDRDPPLLLLLQPVGIGAGQRAHEGTLPVVDVPGRPEDHGFRHERYLIVIDRLGYYAEHGRLLPGRVDLRILRTGGAGRRCRHSSGRNHRRPFLPPRKIFRVGPVPGDHPETLSLAHPSLRDVVRLPRRRLLNGVRHVRVRGTGRQRLARRRFPPRSKW